MSDSLWAAMQLSDHPDVCAALAKGLAVPRHRLRPGALATIGEPTAGDDFILTAEVALLCEVRLNGANGGSAESGQSSWLIDAADLLAEPDPGPTPWLVENLIVDQALLAAVGQWKTTKSYGLLDVAISIVTGRPAFGQLEIPKPGPVVFVIEESGRAALWRRLDALTRGRAIPREELRGLHLSANARVKLDDREWQKRLLEAGQRIRPRLFVFDPLARMKASERVENDQSDMAALIEYLRVLRDETGATVGFVQHTGHTGTHMRGSSDLESVWETRLTWKRSNSTSPTVELSSEHREAEAGPSLEYQIAWDGATRTMRFTLSTDVLVEQVKAFLAESPDASANDVAKALGGTRAAVLEAVRSVRGEGGTDPLEPPRTTFFEQPFRGGSQPPPFRGAGTTSGTAGSDSLEPLLPGDAGFVDWVDDKLQCGYLTEVEWLEQRKLHALVVT
jgi:AAA domain